MLVKQGIGKISWTDFTWNPVRGCKHGCSYCYMIRLVKRGIYDMTPAFNEKAYNMGRKQLGNKKDPVKVFVCSAADLLGDWVPKEWIDKVIGVFKENSQHTFQILTKNPTRYNEFEFPSNCWLGTTMDGSEKTLFNGNILLTAATKNGNETSKNKLFISFEPLLSNITLQDGKINLTGLLSKMSWIIIGANSNKDAVKPPMSWAKKLLTISDQFKVPVHIKNNYKYFEERKEWPK